MAPPPPGGDLAPPPGGDLAPPPGDKMFPEEPKKEAQHEKSSKKGGKTYEVRKGDSLWKIAGKSSIYGDSFHWPLLFIANREKIKDPDIIHTGWDLKVTRDMGQDEINHAVEKAKETPRYEPHTAPRKRLPIEY
jgi:nucleoid-associated protein YgaU